MVIMHCDIETYSSVDLSKSGVYAYAEAEDFEILLFGYAFDDEAIQLVDLACGEELPKDVFKTLQDSTIIKTAFNANFERTCLAKYFNIPMPAEPWCCTQAHALTLGLPLDLKRVAERLKLKHQKMQEGKNLIRFFSIPAAVKNHDQVSLLTWHRNMAKDYPEKWQLFKDYCIRDVEVEREICKKLTPYPLPQKEQKLWVLDQKINDFGVKVDKTLVKNAIRCAEQYHRKLIKEARDLTGLENPNSAEQLKDWLSDNYDMQIKSLSKTKVSELLKEADDPVLKRALELRQKIAKTSIKKYEAMGRTLCKDGRIRGLLQYYGSNRGGRWAGRLVQVHNLPRNHLQDLSLARDILKSGNYDLLEMLYDSVQLVLSQLIRTALVPEDGCRFIVCDFSAIEARVIAWLAGEKWRLKVFNSHGKIYEASAAQMFKVPIESITKDSDLRQKGKMAELACGYGGSIGALISMGAVRMGVDEKDLPKIIQAWRKSNPNIVKLWRDVENAAIKAVKEKTLVTLQYSLQFQYHSGGLFIQLPSGRKLAYVRPRIETDEKFNKETLTYEGIAQHTKQWDRIRTFGAKLVENIVQGTARDCLAEALLKLDAIGYRIAFHVHDEVVLEAPSGFGSLKEVESLMSQDIQWAPGLPMNVTGFETGYYIKN